MTTFAGVDNYISGVSSNTSIKNKQLWHYLTGKVLFRLSCMSNGQYVCHCGMHTEYSIEIQKLGLICKDQRKKVDLSEYPIHDIVHDGYEFNKQNLNGCHKLIFT